MANAGSATPFRMPAKVRNHGAKNAERQPLLMPGTDPIQNAIQPRLNATNQVNGMGHKPNAAGKHSWKPVSNSSTK
jgi:hypothetical protein